MSPRTDSTGIAEHDLVAGAGRDPAMFADLYRRHHRAVHLFALMRLRHPQDAEDVASEVFLRALGAIGRYQDRGIPFERWLLQIAANVVADLRRRRRPCEDIEQYSELAARISVEDLVVEHERLLRIARAARRLPVRQRQVLALRFGRDLRIEDVARQMGGSQGAVKLLQHRALRAMRGILGAEAGALELAS